METTWTSSGTRRPVAVVQAGTLQDNAGGAHGHRLVDQLVVQVKIGMAAIGAQHVVVRIQGVLQAPPIFHHILRQAGGDPGHLVPGIAVAGVRHHHSALGLFDQVAVVHQPRHHAAASVGDAEANASAATLSANCRCCTFLRILQTALVQHPTPGITGVACEIRKRHKQV
jgi:hypothetical protein